METVEEEKGEEKCEDDTEDEEDEAVEGSGITCDDVIGSTLGRICVI